MNALSAATRLRGELEALSNVLISGDGTTLVAMEERLALAVDALSKHDRIDGSDRPPLAAAVLGVRAALLRCRTLGAGIAHVAQATLAARGQQANYDHHAGVSAASQSVRGISVDARL